jgi:hypothetical protein
MLAALLRWWPEFLRIESRFQPCYGDGWSAWCYAPLKLSFDSGMPKAEVDQLQSLPAKEAGARIAAWYAGVEAARSTTEPT